MYELLLTLHIVAAALYFGSGLAIWVISQRLLTTAPASYGPFALQAGWWAGKAHPAALLLLIIAGGGMMADAGYSWGEPWVILALAGWFVLGGIGGGGVANTGRDLEAAFDRQAPEGEIHAVASKLHLFMRIETVILVLVIADMVIKPGS